MSTSGCGGGWGEARLKFQPFAAILSAYGGDGYPGVSPTSTPVLNDKGVVDHTRELHVGVVTENQVKAIDRIGKINQRFSVFSSR